MTDMTDKKTAKPLFIVITGNQGGKFGKDITYLKNDYIGETTFLPYAAVLSQEQLDHFTD